MKAKNRILPISNKTVEEIYLTKNKKLIEIVEFYKWVDKENNNQLARKMREETNNLTRTQRDNLFEKGMQIIYES